VWYLADVAASLEGTKINSIAMQSNTTHALKEWAAVDALEQGKTIMLLLRKGGIHEQGGRFKVAQNQILLYPTHEHQQPF